MQIAKILPIMKQAIYAWVIFWGLEARKNGSHAYIAIKLVN